MAQFRNKSASAQSGYLLAMVCGYSLFIVACWWWDQGGGWNSFFLAVIALAVLVPAHLARNAD